MRKLILAVALLLAGPLQAETFKDAFPDIIPQIKADMQQRTGEMQLLHGTVQLDGGEAQVVVPDGYYFLGPADARYVIEKVWGNPDGSGVLGLLVPANMSTFASTDWAAIVSFDPMGYVSDADAEGYDYDALLKSMQDDVASENVDRKKQGFPAVTLLGWAEPPHYDKTERKLIWAKRLTFDGNPVETLNYNIRALGRKGVMVINFIAATSQLAEIKAAAPAVSHAVSFTDGNKYSDFLPNVDTVAAVGIGGLIAGKVLSSTGILAVALVLAKKVGIFVVVGLAWGWRKVKAMMSGKSGGTPST